METNRKVKAFTLFELILGMLLSAIVIGMVYSAWFLFTGAYTRYAAGKAAQSELRVFKLALAGDVEAAALVKGRDNELILLDTGGAEWLRYRVGADEVLRVQATAVDTFRLSQVQLRSVFGGMPAEETIEAHGGWDGERETEGSVVDELQFRFRYQGLPMLVSVRKRYASKELFDVKSDLTRK